MSNRTETYALKTTRIIFGVLTMMTLHKLTQSVVVFFGILLPLTMVNIASARDFKIGYMKNKNFGDSFCGSFLPGSNPNSNKYMLLIPPVFIKKGLFTAWINIDGRNISLKEFKSKTISPNSTEYKSKNISVLVNSRIKKKNNDLGLNSVDTVDKILINYREQLKTIRTTGICS